MRWFAASVVMVCGCSGGLVEDDVAGLRRVSGTVKMKAKGRQTVEVDVAKGEGSLLLTAAALEPFRTHVLAVRGPDGAVYTSGWAAPDHGEVHSHQRFACICAGGEVRADQAHRGCDA